MIARRYLALVSVVPGQAAASAEQVASACGLSVAFASARMSILTETSSHCVKLESGEGAFVGTLFTAPPEPKRISSVPRATSHAILADSGQTALRSYWGGYVLFCDDAHIGKLTVSRDPSGAMPCYRVETDSLNVFASDLATLIAAGFVTPAIEDSALLRHIMYPDLRLEETCIAGVADVLPGMRLDLEPAPGTIQPWWSPWAFAGDASPGSARGLADQLRGTVDDCVAAWASCCQHPLLGLSGGLDSSIVASALAQAVAGFSALNMVDEDADGDERPYARLVARALGIALTEAPYDPSLVDLRMPSVGHLPRPIGTAHFQPFEIAARRMIESHGIDAWFNGMGGDNVFCWTRSALPVADSIISRRNARAIWQTVRDVAVLSDVSSLAVLRQTLRLLLRGRRPLRPRGVARLLTEEARRRAAPLRLPPWFTAPGRMAPGRAHHVEMITRVQTMVEGLDRWTWPATVVPLLSQPVVELCLRTPSWHWVAGARNRAVARDAYTGRLPDRVIDRRSKGGPDRMSIAVCLENLPLLREMLLDGYLAQQGWLDCKLVENMLNSASFLRRAHHSDILQLADTEAWISHWRARGNRASTTAHIPAL